MRQVVVMRVAPRRRAQNKKQKLNERQGGYKDECNKQSHSSCKGKEDLRMGDDRASPGSARGDENLAQ